MKKNLNKKLSLLSFLQTSWIKLKYFFENFDSEHYADDPDCPTPLDSANNVVVEEIDVGQNDSVQSFVLERVDPLRKSSQMGIDIFQEALELVKVKLGQLAIA